MFSSKNSKKWILYKKLILTKLNNKYDYKNKWIKLENNGFLETGKQISKIIEMEYCEKIQKPDIVYINNSINLVSDIKFIFSNFLN